MKYIIYSRYETWTASGKTFTRWFITPHIADTELEAKTLLKACKEKTKDIDRHTKCKHEYEIRYLDETLLPQPHYKRVKGRRKKIDNSILESLAAAICENEKHIIPAEYAPYIMNHEEYQNVINNYVTNNKPNHWVRYWYSDDNIPYLLLKTNDKKMLDI